MFSFFLIIDYSFYKVLSLLIINYSFNKYLRFLKFRIYLFIESNIGSKKFDIIVKTLVEVTLKNNKILT